MPSILRENFSCYGGHFNFKRKNDYICLIAVVFAVEKASHTDLIFIAVGSIIIGGFTGYYFIPCEFFTPVLVGGPPESGRHQVFSRLHDSFQYFGRFQ